MVEVDGGDHRAAVENIVDQIDADGQLPDVGQRCCSREVRRICNHNLFSPHGGNAAERDVQVLDGHVMAQSRGCLGVHDGDEPVPVPENSQQDGSRDRNCGYDCGGFATSGHIVLVFVINISVQIAWFRRRDVAFPGDDCNEC
jgi:hypothetical protein